MIKTFQSKPLEQFFNGKPKGIAASLRRKVANILFSLNTATDIEAMNLPGYRLHELSGDLAGTWSVTVNHNWRITFRFEGGDAYDVDFIDYH